MRTRAAYKRIALGGATFIVVVIVLLILVGRSVKWVGKTDLEVRFAVTDAASGRPIPNATIYVRAEPDGFCEELNGSEFEITTDEDGCATRLCKNCMCFGSRRLVGDSFAVHLPSWWFHVTATGYSPTNPEYLDIPTNARKVQRLERSATIAVPVLLRKSDA